MISKKHFLTVIIMLFILFSTVASAQYYLDYSDSETANSYYTAGEEVTNPDWYDVSDEEIRFCQSFGGTNDVENIYISGSSSENFQPVSKLTIAIQGYYTTEYDKRLYEMGWYVQPLAEDITYTVLLTKEDGSTEEFITLPATATDGSAYYEAFESTELYTEISIVMVDGSRALTVPFVEK